MIRRKPKKFKPQIDLSGPQGNAFYLMAVVDKTFRQSGAPNLGKSIVEEMKKGDYEHLVETFDKHFGHFVTLYR